MKVQCCMRCLFCAGALRCKHPGEVEAEGRVDQCPGQTSVDDHNYFTEVLLVAVFSFVLKTVI